MNPEKKKWASRTTVIVFCALLFGFAAATGLKPASAFSETENRLLAQRPEVSAEAVLSGDFEADYEAYLSDQFVLRDQWIGLKVSVERLLLKRESQDIYFAEDGYLIEKHTGVFHTEMAARNRAYLTAFARQYAAEFGAEHLSVLIVPNAADVLWEKLPPFASPGEGGDYLKLLAEELPDGVWLDTTAVLREHADEALFYRTDHHWKTLAAFYVYQAWASARGYAVPALADYEIQTVTDSFQGTVQSKLGIQTAGDTIELFLPRHEVPCVVHEGDSTKSGVYDGGALETKDKYAVFFGGNAPFLQIDTEAEGGRSVLVIKDSYANCFIPFMLEEFQRIDVVDLRYTDQKLSGLIETGTYTDLLILYNASGFAGDMSLAKLTN